ncbi:hypothetical protein O3P69_020969 [Scylla paramamosain]|uniref:Reverse transcriptase domain-containing protein n=1 Tax=Scylla paramamosain TaxID=85552 RepID=A0AAW0SAU9_SCYPA
MENHTSDLRGVVVFLDDILVCSASAEEHFHNLCTLLYRLQDKGLCCNWEKYVFAQSAVEYLDHTLSHHGITKGRKVDAVAKMPPPTNVTELCSFLGSVQFYNKFVHHDGALTCLTRKDTAWRWEAAFQRLKVLCTEAVLAHFGPTKKISIACDASEVGISRTPLDFGHSPNELLNGRQIRCKLDTLLPSPTHAAQGQSATDKHDGSRQWSPRHTLVCHPEDRHGINTSNSCVPATELKRTRNQEKHQLYRRSMGSTNKNRMRRMLYDELRD